MNSNLFHNILNVAIAVTGAATAALIALGCKDVSGALDCSGAFISPVTLGLISSGLGVLKLVINGIRDGVSGMVAPQPPVEKK